MAEQSIAEQIQEAIQLAAQKGIELDPNDFQVIDSQAWIDGMRPAEWVDAMTME